MKKSNMCFILSIMFLIMVVQPLFSESYLVSGHVKMEDGSALGGVSVWINKTTIKTSTDVKGYFSFYLPKTGKYLLMVHLLGFDMEMLPVEIKGKSVYYPAIILKKEKKIYEITITQKVPKIMSSDESIGTVFVQPEELVNLPSLGEPDVFRSLQLLPGINASSESSGLYIRGGKPDQNLILFDGFTIYHVDHFFGIFSAFNSSSIDQIKLFKGGFESKYGGRLSSIMELSGKSGNSEKLSAGFGVNFLSFNGYLSTPLGEKGTLFLSGRQSFQSPLYKSILDKYNDTDGNNRTSLQPAEGPGRGGFGGTSFESEPISYFYDFNGKLTYNISSKDLLTVSFYTGKDNLDNSREVTAPSFGNSRFGNLGIQMDVEGEYTDVTKWGNTGLSFNWFREWSRNFSSTATVGYSKYFNQRDLNSTMRMNITVDPGVELPEKFKERFQNGERNIENITYIDNNLTDKTFRLMNTWHLNQNNQIDFGFSLTANEIDYVYSATRFSPNNEQSSGSVEPENILDIHEKGSQLAFYLQDKITLFEGFCLTPGLRVTHYNLTDEWFFEPRFSFVLNLSKELKLKGAYGKFYQFANNIIREDVLQGDQDFWILSNGSTVPISSAIHYIGGISYETENYLFDLEFYRKELEGLSEFNYRTQRGQTDINYYDYFFEGTGVSTGIEFLIQKKFGNFSGWICYTLGEVEYNFPGLSDDTFPASHSVNHEFKLVGSYQLKDWIFSATWIYASGRPYTAPIGVTEESIYNPRIDREIIKNVIDYGPKNGLQLPDYHRLDLSVTYNFEIGSFKTSSGLSLFNLYNQKNVWRFEYEVIEEEFIQTEVNYLGFTPSLFFKISF